MSVYLLFASTSSGIVFNPSVVKKNYCGKYIKLSILLRLKNSIIMSQHCKQATYAQVNTLGNNLINAGRFGSNFENM